MFSLTNKPAELPAAPHLLCNEHTSQSKQKSSIVFNYPVQGGLGFLPDVHIISLPTTSSSLYWKWRADPKALPQKTPSFWGELRGWHGQGQRSLCPWSGCSGCLCFCRVGGSEFATNVQSRTITITNVNEQAIGTDLCRLLED